MGADALRYFLLREIVLRPGRQLQLRRAGRPLQLRSGQRLGNLASRTLTMINQYRDGYIPAKTDVSLTDTIRRVQQFYDDFEFSRALEEIWSAISWLDGYHRAAAALETGQEPGRRSAGPTRRRALHGGRVHAHDHCAGLSRPAGDGAKRSGACSGCRTRSRIRGSWTWPISRCRRGRKCRSRLRCFRASKPSQAIEKMKELEVAETTATGCAVRKKSEEPERRVRRIDDLSRVATVNNGTVHESPRSSPDHDRRFRQGRPARRAW